MDKSRNWGKLSTLQSLGKIREEIILETPITQNIGLTKTNGDGFINLSQGRV